MWEINLATREIRKRISAQEYGHLSFRYVEEAKALMAAKDDLVLEAGAQQTIGTAISA